MRFKLDENVPVSLLDELRDLGHDADTVWAAAQAEERMLVTQDLDFSDVRRFEPGTHAGVLLVRLHEPGAASIRERVGAALRSEPVEDWKRCLVVLTDTKLRVRRPE